MKKLKFLTITSAMLTATTPVIFATACNKNKPYEELTTEFKQQVISEFVELVKTPHISGHTKLMADKLYEIFTNIPNIGDEIKKTWYMDDYRNPDTKVGEIESTGNICFDVPAADGCELWPTVTLQGHHDMVGAGTTEDPTVGVEAVIDGNVIHSKRYQSSLGADDGIGLAIIITLLKNHNKFKHGPLHILITSDEECDTSGAYVIPKNCDNEKKDMVGENSHFLINIDAEADKKITVSCASTFSNNWKLKFIEKGHEMEGYSRDFIEEGDDEYSKEIYPYTIKVSGLKGGHSANEINKGRYSAIKVLSGILKTLNHNNILNIISFTSNNKSNQISPSAEATFWCDGTLIDDIRNYVINPTLSDIKKNSEDDKDVKIEITESGKQKNVRRLNSTGSFKLYDALQNASFGPLQWIDTSLKEVATSANIGKVTFDASKTGDDAVLNLSTFIRSCIVGNDRKISDYNHSCFNTLFGTGNVLGYENPETSPTWKYTPENKLHDLFAQGYKNIGIDSIKRNAHSWLECAYFGASKKHANDLMIAVGPLITDAHSKAETIYLDTLDPLISSLLYTLKNMNKLA